MYFSVAFVPAFRLTNDAEVRALDYMNSVSDQAMLAKAARWGSTNPNGWAGSCGYSLYVMLASSLLGSMSRPMLRENTTRGGAAGDCATFLDPREEFGHNPSSPSVFAETHNHRGLEHFTDNEEEDITPRVYMHGDEVSDLNYPPT